MPGLRLIRASASAEDNGDGNASSARERLENAVNIND